MCINKLVSENAALISQLLGIVDKGIPWQVRSLCSHATAIMTDSYDPKIIEPKWQAYWDQTKTFRTPDDEKRPKAYILDMFPYPSGAGLHVGHPEGYTATDIVARYLRATGRAVLHPMGWDAFGLPAEQHAIRTGTHPRVTTAANISTFKRQLKMLGFSYDWDREIDTTDPNYVRWTQWIFLKLFHRGLAYQAEVPVNWCAQLGTVLANEEVQDGKSVIGGYSVERTPLRQWMLKITAYADRLLDDLALADWPESTRAMQREWIGRSVGAEVRFGVEGSDRVIEVFTTRPDTLFGVTYLALAPEHPWVSEISAETHRAHVHEYVDKLRAKADRDRQTNASKTGVFTGAFAVHPLNGTKIPIWIADYVLFGYGTGAVMGVPAHDQRDFDFAQTHHLPIIEVVSVEGHSSAPMSAAYEGEGTAVRSGAYDGLSTAEFKTKVAADLESAGKGRKRIQYKLRDWVFSRQRYWGEPIPIYFPVETDGDPRKGAAYRIRHDQPIAVSESELPLRLPELEDFRPGTDPAGPLARAVDWRFFERDGKWFARETNTMPQWAGSCWYYLRFMDPHNGSEGWSKKMGERWLPVDLYVGGAEHAVLHLLYSRFWHKVLFDEKLVSCPEPFKKLVHQGMILGEVEYTSYCDNSGNLVSLDDVDENSGSPIRKSTKEPLTLKKINEGDVEKNKAGSFVMRGAPGVIVEARAHKMSKSRGNVVNPDDIVEQFGADAMRVYEMFMGPLEATKPWSTHGILGVRRFLERIFACAKRAEEVSIEPAFERTLHRTIRKVTQDIEALHFNTAISTMMILSNDLAKQNPIPKSAAETLTRLVHPFAPHLGEELWEMLGHPPSIEQTPWPTFDPALCEEDQVEVAVQINGKVRGVIVIGKDATEQEAMDLARTNDKVTPHLEGKTVRKTIWVKGKILNLIVVDKA